MPDARGYDRWSDDAHAHAGGVPLHALLALLEGRCGPRGRLGLLDDVMRDPGARAELALLQVVARSARAAATSEKGRGERASLGRRSAEDP